MFFRVFLLVLHSGAGGGAGFEPGDGVARGARAGFRSRSCRRNRFSLGVCCVLVTSWCSCLVRTLSGLPADPAVLVDVGAGAALRQLGRGVAWARILWIRI